MHMKPIALPLALSMLIPFGVAAKLPAPSEEVKQKAAETAAKAAWNDKVAAYKLCLSMDRTAEAYRRNMKAAGKEPPAPIATAPCGDPGPFTPITPVASKPLEAAEAHSPPGTAHSPPSTKSPHAELTGKK